jgi:4-amino-4-deoxy-L-arabinose transferase-like glycosyltransferase
VIPIAIARALLGDGLPALLLPSLLYATGIVAVLALWASRAAGTRAAAVAMALVVTNPRFVLIASIADIDVAEIFFVVTAFALIGRALERSAATPPWTPLLLAGVSLGLAMLSRETTVFAIAAIGLLFLAGFGMPRANYMIIGIGFVSVVGLEAFWLWWMSGDLLYRSAISLHHDVTIDRRLDQGAGVPLLHPAVDPLTMILFNHNFGLLGWIGVPLTVWLMRRGQLSPPVRRLAIPAVTLAVTWSVIAAAWWSMLVLNPRYFLLPALLISVLSGIALERLWRGGRRRVAGLLGVAMVGANLIALSVDNRDFMYGEHVLVDLAAREPDTIHTDEQTSRRAELLLRWRGLESHVSDAAAGPGELFFLDPTRTDIKPRPDWTVVERQGPRPAIRMWLVTHLVPAKLLSPARYLKLSQGHPDVTLYRLP